MDKLYFPIIVAEGLDVHFYTSVEGVENALETIDVKNNEYIAYDARGNQMALFTEGQQVKLAKNPNLLNLRENLETLLTQFLTTINVDIQDEKRDLESLLNHCAKFYQKN